MLIAQPCDCRDLRGVAGYDDQIGRVTLTERVGGIRRQRGPIDAHVIRADHAHEIRLDPLPDAHGDQRDAPA
jgi:hypothetical protein